jgi:transaldolase
MAAGEHGCESATISPEVLNELASRPYDAAKQPGEGKPKPAHPYAHYRTPDRLQAVSQRDPLAPADAQTTRARTDVDYLADGGAELEKAIAADPVTKQRLEDALTLFTGGLMESKAKIEKWFEEV